MDSPLNPNSIETLPAGMLAIDIGMNIGETLLFPFFTFISHCSCIVLSPPIPDPIKTPVLSKSVFSFVILLSFTASLAAIIANWDVLSSLLACFTSK